MEFLNTETIAERAYKERDREGESERVKEGVIFNVLWALLSEKSQNCKLCVCAYPSTQHIIDLEQMVEPSEDANARSENV